MYDSLLSYVKKYSETTLTDQEEALITASFRLRKIRKKQYFLQEGDVCEYIGFIMQGAMRQYRVDEKDTEHTVNLFIEDWWVSDRESAVMLTPSSYNIEAWEDTELLVATTAAMQELITRIPAFAKMARVMDQRSFIASQKRLNFALSYSAEKRYTAFAAEHPNFLQRFPQHIIASYLGITKDTLSRVRKQTLKK